MSTGVSSGAKEGFGVASRSFPHLVAMLAAISIFRTTGGMDVSSAPSAAPCWAWGLDDALRAGPAVGLKTLSGSGARGLMVDVMTTYLVDLVPKPLAAIIQG